MIRAFLNKFIIVTPKYIYYCFKYIDNIYQNNFKKMKKKFEAPRIRTLGASGLGKVLCATVLVELLLSYMGLRRLLLYIGAPYSVAHPPARCATE